jgi:cell division protein FtsQ
MRDWFLRHPRQSVKLLVLLVVMSALALLSWYVHKPGVLPIEEVTVIGVTNHNEDDVKSIVTTYLNHGLFSVDVLAIKNNLTRLFWIADVNVERIWPNKLAVRVFPEHIVAFWNDDKVIDQYGEAYPLPQNANFKDMPVLTGPKDSQIQMLDYYQRFSEILAPISLKITKLELLPNQDWQLWLDNGINIALGHTNVLDRLSRFVSVYDKVFAKRFKAAKHVDFRYPNGMAVQWSRK